MAGNAHYFGIFHKFLITFFLKTLPPSGYCQSLEFCSDDKTTKTYVINFSGEMVLGVSESVACADS
jgi:hypothetical protein